jgi:hypothetical protein
MEATAPLCVLSLIVALFFIFLCQIYVHFLTQVSSRPLLEIVIHESSLMVTNRDWTRRGLRSSTEKGRRNQMFSLTTSLDGKQSEKLEKLTLFTKSKLAKQ